MACVWLGEIKYMHVCAVQEVARGCYHSSMYNMYVCMYLASYIGAIVTNL